MKNSDRLGKFSLFIKVKEGSDIIFSNEPASSYNELTPSLSKFKSNNITITPESLNLNTET